MTRAAKGVRVWTCDGCGKRETWRKGWWQLYGVESIANPGQPMVVCGDACEDVALAKALKEPS